MKKISKTQGIRNKQVQCVINIANMLELETEGTKPEEKDVLNTWYLAEALAFALAGNHINAAKWIDLIKK